MSDASKKKHPWAKFHAKQRTAGPPSAAPVLRHAPAFPALPVAPATPPPVALPEPPVAQPSDPVIEPPAEKPAAQPTAKRAPRRVPKPAVKSVPKTPKKPPSSSDAWVPPTPQSVETPAGGKPATGGRGKGRASAVSDEMASALKALAAEYAPLPLTSSPFVSAKQREIEARARRQLWRVRMGKLAAGLFVGIGVLYLLVSLVLFRYPPDEALEEEVVKTAQAAVLRYTRGDRPLEIAGAVPVLRQKIGARHVRYYADVTLRLRQPLFGPAVSNGTVSYLQLQESLRWARAQELKFNFFALTGGPSVPELPLLIQEVHHQGEPMVVRVPFEAEQFGWRWRIKPPQFNYVSVDREFSGATLDYFDDLPYLIFGRPETMPDIRERMKAATVFIRAVAKEIQRHSDVEAVVEKPRAAPDATADTPPVTSTEPMAPPDPNKPAVAPGAVAKPEPTPKPMR